MVSEIFNFYAYSDKLAAGGQPTADQMKKLAEAGYETIVSISPVSTRNYLATEAELTEKLQVEFVHFPIDCTNLKDTHYRVFRSIMNELGDKKVFVHCGGNIKTSNLIHMYHVLEKGLNEEDSLKELQKIQKPEEKWFKYFKKFGMQGLS